MEISSDSQVNVRQVIPTPPIPLFAQSDVIDLDDIEINQKESSKSTTTK